MTISNRRAENRARGIVAVVALAVLLGVAGPAAAQCTLAAGPNALSCPDCTTNPALRQTFFQNGWLGLYNSGGSDRLMVPMSWGYIVYSLANGAYPSEIAVDDLRSDATGPGPVNGDGQNYVATYGVGADGQRALLSLQLPGQGTGSSGGGGDTVVETVSGNKFMAMGDTGFKRAGGGLVVQKNGSRYFGWGLDSSGSLFVADITNPTGYSTINKMPSENPALLATRSAGSLGLADGGSGSQFLYALDGANAMVANISNPGPVGSISNGFHGVQITPGDFQLASGYALLGVSGAVDPATGKLYVLGSFWGPSQVPYFSLVLFDPGTQTKTFVGKFSSPDLSFNSPAGTKAGALAVNPFSNDVEAFMWVSNPTTNFKRLYATSAKTFGSPIGQWADVSGMQGNLSGTTVLFKSATDAYVYFWDSILPYATKLNCVGGKTAATGRLAVSNVSAGSPVALSSGATVFVGDTLSITPSVTPPNSIEPVTAWNLDFDYHSAPETGTGPYYTQLTHPDACLSGCSNPFTSNPDPPPFTLVGPCDPRTGGNPTTGQGCWTSVGLSPGNGDFSSTQPPAGTQVTLPIAFEGSNALNGPATVPLATFPIVWKVPAAKVQNLSALLGSGNSATFNDGSDGHPASTGYKWYFGTDKTAQSGEQLTQDVLCSGPSCPHVFTAGKGTYNAWLVTPYKNGFSTPDFAGTCGSGTTCFQLTVTDFVAAFTADSSTFLGNNINIRNQSQKGGGVTGDAYLYNLCDASTGPCAEGTYQTLNIPAGSSGTIPAPATAGTWWLRIKATYTPGPSAQWQPNVVAGHTDAWPVTVSAVPPSVMVLSGANPCTVGCGGSIQWIGTSGTPITVALYQGAQLTGTYSWSASGSGGPSPGSGSGSTFTFTPQNGGSGVTVTVTATGSGLPSGGVSTVIGVTSGSPPPPPPSGLAVYLTASSTSPPVGTGISITAHPSGGSGSYSSYLWNVGDGSAPASLPYGTISWTYTSQGSYTVSCTVTDSQGATASSNLTINVQAPAGPSYALSLIAGAQSCVVGCSGIYGLTGTPITVAAYQGSTQLTSTYNWTVTGGNPTPSSGSGSTFTFTPTTTGMATITNTSLSVSTSVQIYQGTVPDFIVSDAVRGNIAPGTDGSFLLVMGRSTTFTAVNQGTTTPLTGTFAWNFGDGTTDGANPSVKSYSTPDPRIVTLTFAGQTVQHSVFVVTGVPTGGYYSYPADGGSLDPNQVDPGRTILFQATENFAANYSWNFGDGTPVVSGADKATVSHSFATLGSYKVVLTETLGANTFTTALPTTFVVSYTPKWIVPGLAFASGLLPGSFYVTDVVIQNPSKTQPMSLSLTLADGTAPAGMIWKPVQLSPMESRSYANILQSFFGMSSGGPATSLIVKGEVLPANATPVIWASTYNNNGGDPTKGTFGVAIPAVPLSSALSSASVGAFTEFPGLRDVPDYSSRSPLVSYPDVSPAYTNVGFVNPGDVPATLTISFFSSAAQTLFQKLGSDVSLTLAPNESRQITKALTSPSPTGAAWDIIGHPEDNYFMTVKVSGGKVVPYTSLKDIGSSDSVFMTSDGSIATSYRVPAVVRASGQFGAVFRSRLVVFNPSGQARIVQLALSYIKCVPGTTTCDPRQVVTGNLPLLSGQTVIFEDFVKEWLTLNDSLVHDDRDYTTSFVDVSPSDLNTDPILVRAETYNATTSGSFGTQVPGLVASIHGASAASGGLGSRLLIPRALPNGGTGGFRTNVALVLLSGASGTAKVRLYRDVPDAGPIPALPEVSLSLTAGEPFLQRRLEQLFPAISNFGTGNKYTIEIVVTDGTIGAYASINDNVTGDSMVLVARPQQ